MHTFGTACSRRFATPLRARRHEFVFYATGIDRRGPEDVIPIPTTRRYLYRRAARYQARHVLDYVGLPSSPARTWFERSLAEQRIDFVWFATTYAERVRRAVHLHRPRHRAPAPAVVSEVASWASGLDAIDTTTASSQGRRASSFRTRLDAISCALLPDRGRAHALPRSPDAGLCARGGAARPAAPCAGRAARRRGAATSSIPAQFWAHKNHATLFEAVARTRPRWP